MTVETKFDIDNQVWFMWKNKPYQSRVSFIEFRKTSKMKVNEYLKYTCYVDEQIDKNAGKSSSPYTFEEGQLYNTKEELIASL